MQTLQPVRFPRPVPLLIWDWSYDDIRERVLRDGRLDTEEIWLPDSEDSWPEFCRRHHGALFTHDWRQMAEHEAAREAAKAARRAAEAARQQTIWEAERQKRQLEKQAQADREWAEADAARKAGRDLADIATARAFWAARDPGYAGQDYELVKLVGGGVLEGVEYRSGGHYWLPKSLADRIPFTPPVADRERQEAAERDWRAAAWKLQEANFQGQKAFTPSQKAAVEQERQAAIRQKQEATQRRLAVVEEHWKASRAFWSARNPAYAAAPLWQVRIAAAAVIDRVGLAADGVYWLPEPVRARVRCQAL